MKSTIRKRPGTMDGHRFGGQWSFALIIFLFAALPLQTASAQEMSDAELQHTLSELKKQIHDSIQVNGYYAFEYLADNRATSPNSFRQHNFNFFFGRDWERFRVLTEIEFEDGPAFDEATGAPPLEEAKGNINMEYGWFQYQHSDALKVRGGKFLLHQFWSLNHYPPVTLSTTRPLMVRKIFPMNTIGLMLHGRLFAGNVGLGYNAYYANGQHDTPTDDDENKAVGGHLTLMFEDAFDALTHFHVGASTYLEKRDTPNARDALGFDLQFSTRGFEVLAEYATNNEGSDEGFYVQPSLNLTEKLRWFYRYDYFDDGVDVTKRHTSGFKLSLAPDIVLKLEGFGESDDNPVTEDYDGLASSVALFF